MKITHMDVDESELVSQMVANAFYAKFSGKTSLNKQMIQKIVKLIWLEEANAFGMSVYTVKVGKEVAAAFGVSTRQKIRPSIRLGAKALAVIKKIGWRDFISFIKVGWETNRTPESDEWYIDFIVVKEGHRNQNLGHAILSALDEMVTRDPKAGKLSLYVLKSNARARHLYLKYGFSEKIDLQKIDYHFMVKESPDRY
ncbi:MAG: GNAT family N-acetyltransferase [Alkalibacterium sp.]|nr:GNAT family N-acetyltransferase [Alkalibacterium sp.]